MARGFSPRTTTDIQLMEQGVCNVVQGRTVNQHAAHVRRVVAAGLMLFAAVVVCAAVVGSSSSSSSSSTGKVFGPPVLARFSFHMRLAQTYGAKEHLWDVGPTAAHNPLEGQSACGCPNAVK